MDSFWPPFFGFLTIITVSIIGHVVNWLNNRALREEVKTVKDNVQKIEVATNSMKDALIISTEKEALARGGVEERARADKRAGQ